jgi:hypothetical protein
MPRKFCAVSARIWVSPDALTGSPPAMTSARPPLSRKTIASRMSASTSLPRTASSTNGRYCSVRRAVANTPPGLFA